VAFIGSFLEEIVSPLPSFMVLVPVGVAADVQGYGALQLAIIALCAGLGRVPAAFILYMVAHYSGDTFLRNHTFFGVTRKDVEKFSARLQQSGRRNWWVLLSINALPMVPTAVLSLACGFAHVPRRMFLTTTFIGTTVNALFYVVLGYGGIRIAETLSGLELAGRVVSVTVVLGVVSWVIWRRVHKRALIPKAKKNHF